MIISSESEPHKGQNRIHTGNPAAVRQLFTWSFMIHPAAVYFVTLLVAKVTPFNILAMIL
jgi:hypothetical protein